MNLELIKLIETWEDYCLYVGWGGTVDQVFILKKKDDIIYKSKSIIYPLIQYGKEGKQFSHTINEVFKVKVIDNIFNRIIYVKYNIYLRGKSMSIDIVDNTV
jgi:hypothetical protein